MKKTCNTCKHKVTLADAAHGVGEMLKTRFGVGVATDLTVGKRLYLCYHCEHGEPVGKPKTCNQCGCFVKEKALRADESCPIGKWGAEVEQPAGE